MVKERNSLFRKAYNSTLNPIKRVSNLGLRRGLIGLGLAGIVATGLCTTSKAHSNELALTTALYNSSVGQTEVDSDRDGLSDRYENLIGTDPLNSDTDSDGYNDGIEEVNIVSLDSDPLNFESPSPGHLGYAINNQTPLFPTDSLSNRLMPTLSHNGLAIAYVKTDTNFQNAGIYLTTIAEPRTEILVANLNDFSFNQVAFGPNNRTIYFSDIDARIPNTTNLFKYDISTSEITKLTNLVALQHISDPATVTYPISSPLTNKNWLFTSNENVVRPNTSEITAYRITRDGVDFNNPVSIIDLVDIAGLESWPRLNADGKSMIFSNLISSTNSRAFVVNGIEDILLGNTSKIIDMGDNRVDFASISDRLTIPVGFSPTRRVFYMTSDENKVFDFSLNNFKQANFDLWIGSLNNEGTVSNRNRIPLVGNQFSGAVSADGTQIILSSDHDFTSSTTHNLHEAGINSLNRVPWNRNRLSGNFELEDPSGVKLFLPDLTGYTFPEKGGIINGTISMSSISLIDRIYGIYDIATAESLYGFSAIRDFEPDGMIFEININTPTLTRRYLESEIPEFTKEEDLTNVRFNEETGAFDIVLRKVNHDLEENVLESEILGFSRYALRSQTDLTDSDSDGLPNAFEEYIGTDPLNPDTDGDGLTDREEITFDGNPNYNPLNDTDPLNPDSDFDGFDDGVEIAAGTYPLDSTSFPTTYEGEGVSEEDGEIPREGEGQSADGSGEEGQTEGSVTCSANGFGNRGSLADLLLIGLAIIPLAARRKFKNYFRKT